LARRRKRKRKRKRKKKRVNRRQLLGAQGEISEETLWAIVEAYLFEIGRAASLEDLARPFKGVLSEAEVEASLERMEQKGWQEGRGVILVARKGMWALEVRGKAPFIERLKRSLATTSEDELAAENFSEGEKTVSKRLWEVNVVTWCFC
jgi:hypothetical protein